MSARKVRSFVKIFLPFFVSFLAVFGAFGALVLLKFRDYEVPVLKNEIFALLFAFAGVFSFVMMMVVLFLYRRMQRVSSYADQVVRGGTASGPREDVSGVFQSLLSGIDTISARLRERAEAAEEEKKRVLAIVESMAEGAAVIDADQRILLVNTALAQAFGLRQEGVQGRYFWEVFRDPDINEMIQKGLQGRQNLQKEHSALLTDSTFQIQVSPAFRGQEFLGVIAVFHDVTRLKKLETLRSEFVANVSHELKTPLTSILGFVETLKEGGLEDVENRAKFLYIIEEHAQKLHRLIEDLLFLSAVESGKGELKKEKLDLERLLKEALGFFEKPLRKKSIQVSFEISPKPFFIQAEKGSFERALANLIDNAIKYNHDGGRIFFEARDEGGAARIQVRDTGIGIAAADLPRIFERFYRAEKSRSRESGGTGLGLSIAKHIVERHGGRLQASSPGAGGASFVIYLPG